MNSTLKTTIIVIVVLLLVATLFRTGGWFGAPGTMTDNGTGNVSSLDTDSTNVNNSPSNSKTGSTNSASHASATVQVSALSEARLLELMGAVTLRVPQTGVDVALYKGQADFTDSAVKGHIALGRILGKVPTDNGYDVFVDMAISTGGSGVMHYVALFHNVGQTVAYTSAVFVGDRITLNNVTAVSLDKSVIKKPQTFMTSSTGYVLNVAYMDRKNGEPMTTAPSLAKSVALHVKNHIVGR